MSTVPNQSPSKLVTPQPGRMPRFGIAIRLTPPYTYHQINGHTYPPSGNAKH